MRRIIVIVLLAGVIAALVATDHAPSSAKLEAGPPAPASAMPVAASATAPSTTFYCAGGTAGAAGGGNPYDATVVIANAGATRADAVVTVYPGAALTDTNGLALVSQQKPASTTVAVDPYSRAEVPLASVQKSVFGAATVEVSAGDVAVEQRIGSGNLGTSSAPCASAPAGTWYFPMGFTLKGSFEALSLFNPFRGDAVVDVTFQTSDGFRAPARLQGLPLPGEHLTVVDVTADVPLLPQVSMSVTARSGLLVASRLQAYNGTENAHVAGLSAIPGAPAPALVWVFAEGEATDGLFETFTLYNPGDTQAEVDLEVTLDQADTNGRVDPIPVTVPARSYAQVAMRDQTRVPSGVAHNVVARSRNGVPFVVERTIEAAPPAPRRGFSTALGAPAFSSVWLFADGRAVPSDTAEFLIVFNPGTAPATVDVNTLVGGQSVPVDGMQDLVVPPGDRLTVDVGQHLNRPDVTLVVTVDHPVAVERGLFAAKGPGLSFNSGIPAIDSAVLP